MITHLEATRLRENLYAVRPKGALGTCGWINGRAWTVRYIRAASPEGAVALALRMDDMKRAA